MPGENRSHVHFDPTALVVQLLFHGWTGLVEWTMELKKKQNKTKKKKTSTNTLRASFALHQAAFMQSPLSLRD